MVDGKPVNVLVEERYRFVAYILENQKDSQGPKKGDLELLPVEEYGSYDNHRKWFSNKKSNPQWQAVFNSRQGLGYWFS